MTRKTFQEWLDRRYGPAFQRPPDPRVVPPGVSRAERQARTALRWYSPSWREVHGEELLTTVLEAAATSRPDHRSSRALKLRMRVDLALSGLKQRRRFRPSHRRRSFLLAGWELPNWQGACWLRDRLDQQVIFRKELASVVALIVLTLIRVLLPLVSTAAGESLAGLVLFAFWALAIANISFRRNDRPSAIRRARLTDAGWPLAWNPPPPWYISQQLPPPPPGTTNLGPPIDS
jgi:hypothetical protein